ncbi:ABC transporter ATP-binding protein [Azospirillum sp. A26]|uniref:ABC transporter ATP-binding protein n=1 Tax=Azospirillum sp. A26 TaxID=3160607 RepID=UPI00366EA000
MTPTELSLEITDLSVDFGVVPALRGVSLALRRGRIATIIGANGAGKSTIMKAVCGLVKPRGGSVSLFGKPITGLPADEIVVRGLSLVPEGRRLFGSMTIRENLELGAYRRRDRQRVGEDFARVLDYFPALRDRLSTPVGSLSGGQQQMVAVGRALMSAPRILLLDEPTIGLAPAVVDDIAGIVKTIGRSGVDVLLVEQNAEVALSIADYGYILENGSIVAEDESAVLARSETVQRAYLGI